IKLANYAREPQGHAPCIWFWGSRSATWFGDGFQAGWRFAVNPELEITFHLEVVQTLTDEPLTWRGRIHFVAEGPPEFTLVGPFRIDGSPAQTESSEAP